AVVRIPRALPLGHPVAEESEPIWTAADARRIGIRRGERRCQAHWVEVNGLVIRVRDFVHQVANALVRGQVIQETPIGGLANASFLSAAAAMAYVVARPEARKTPEMIDIHFAGVPRHGFGHAEDIGSAGAQEAVPEPHIRPELTVVPGVAAHVVAPFVPRS